MSIKAKPVGYIKISKAGKAHIPKIILRECEARSIPFVINAHSVLLFNPTLDLSMLLASIEVLKEDLKLRYRSPEPASSKALKNRVTQGK